MAYTYNSQNQVTYIHDAAPNPSLPPNVFGGNTKGFVENNQVNMMAGDHYEYDYNGNMKADKHKGMTIEYNYLNLPQVITFSGNRTITFVYDASGAKLQKITNDNGAKITYNYVNGVEYKDDVLQRLAHTEGAVVRNEFGAYDQEYVLRDHLGNARVIFKDGTNKGDAYYDDYWNYINPNAGNTGYNDGVITQSDIKTINNYYPFGMDMEGNWNGSFDAANNKYKYNDKEWNNDFGLGLYDYGARFYDPAVGRWSTIDPLGEKYLSYSPYNYVMNRPTILIDPTGMSAVFDPNSGELTHADGEDAQNYFRGMQKSMGSNRVGNRVVENLKNDFANGKADIHDTYGCYPSTWVRLQKGYADIFGQAPSIFTKSKWEGKDEKGRKLPNSGTRFELLFATSAKNRFWLSFPVEYRGKGAAGALVDAGYAEYVKDVNFGDLKPGAALQLWNSEEQYQSARDGYVSNGHSVIFMGYGISGESTVQNPLTGETIKIIIPNYNIIYYSDQAHYNNVLNRAEYPVVFGANLIDKQ